MSDDYRGVGVVVPAAGQGSRMGGLKKPFVDLSGREVVAWAVAPFLARLDVSEVVIAVGAGGGGPPGAPERGSLLRDDRVRFVTGGASRFESVWAGVRSLGPEIDVVAVHDGARPFPPGEVVDECIRISREGVGAVAAVPATDTIKIADEDQSVLETPPRGRMWYAQTPQVFPRAMLERAFRRCAEEGVQPTDDAQAVELDGGVVRLVRASTRNLKITFAEDVVVAEALIQAGLV